MKKRIIVFGCFAVLVLSGLCRAGSPSVPSEAGEPSSQFTMDEVVVTATRQEEKISSVPANVTVITENDIKNSTARDIPDLLRTQVGIHVNDIGGNRRNYTIDLRGFGETAGLNTLVLVDGRRINQADLSGTDWTLISLDRVKRIEIIRGGRGSVLYGDNAAGGVINIITKEGEAFKTGAEVLAGSYDTFKASAYASGSQNDLSYALSGSYYNSDGYRDNSDSEAKDLGANLSYYVGDRMTLNLSSDFHKDSTGLPGAIKQSDFAAGVSRDASKNPNDFANVEDYYIKTTPEVFFLNDGIFKFDLSFRKRRWLSFSSFTGGFFEGDTEIETVAVAPQIILKENLFGLHNRLTLGLDFQDADEEIINNSSFAGQSTFNLGKKNYGYYVHDELNVLRNLAISGGYRHDRAEFGFQPSAPDQTTMDVDLFTAGINYNYYEKSSVYFSYSQSFRYPVLDELFNFITNTIETGLRPQTADDYEFGIRHYFSENLYANLNLFRIDTKDEILFNPAAGFFGANENLDGETRRDGVEISLSKAFNKLSIIGSYTYTDATIKGGQYDGKKIPNVPKNQASFDTLYSFGNGLSVAFNGVYVGERPFISDFSNAFNGQEDYFVLNAKLKYKWKNISAFVDINNILDEEYSEYGTLSVFSFPVEEAFYPSPKINFLLGFSLDY